MAASTLIDYPLLKRLVSFNKNPVWCVIYWFYPNILIFNERILKSTTATAITIIRRRRLKGQMCCYKVWTNNSRSTVITEVQSDFSAISFPGSSSLFSSSLVVEQPWACFTLAGWLWKTLMSRKCRRSWFPSVSVCSHTSLMHRLNAKSTFSLTVFVSDGIVRTTQSHGTKWSPLNSTKYEQLSIFYIMVLIFYN